MRNGLPLRCRFAATALVFACFIVLTSGQSGDGAQRYDLDDGRQWLESGADLTTSSPALLRGAVATAFNEMATAESLLRGVIQSDPRSDAASQAHELLSRIYLRSGQYKRLIENLDRWAKSFPNRREVQNERADVEQFRGLPDQINGPRRGSTLPHDAGDDFSVPFLINGKSATYLLDTGAWVSVMTELEAARLGLAIRAGTGTLGDPSGKGVKVRTAVAKEVTLGSMRFRNVSFAILPNDEPWKSMPPGHGGILGMPVLLAVGRVQWSNGGTWKLGGRPEPRDGGSRNVVFSENHLLLAANVSGNRVFGTLDTGAVTTDLNNNFATQFAALIQRSGTKETRDITGLGGTVSVDAVTLPEIVFDISGVQAALRPAAVTLQRTSAIGGNCCVGNFGRDLLTQTGEFTLDLSAMTLHLQ